MKFLDERITFTVTIGGTVESRPEKGIYTYQLIQADGSYEEQHTVFAGSVFYNRNQSLTIDVTDIMRNTWTLLNANRQYLISSDNTQYQVAFENICRECWLKVDFGGTTGTLTSSHELIINVYRYPNLSEYNRYLDGSLTFFDSTSSSFLYKFSLLLQGGKYGTTNVLDLVPHYPLINTNYLKVALGFQNGFGVQQIEMTARDGDGLDMETYFYAVNHNQDTMMDTYFYAPISLVMEQIFYAMDYDQYIPTNNPYLQLDDTLYGRKAVVAEFDVCPARYYLQWRDRFGSYQCQGFKDNGTFSEEFTNTEFVTYDDKRRNYNIQIQPKWKIHSGWITPQNYIYYESIFISPFLYLFDTKTKVGREVIVKGNWTENNYKNQKNLLKLELELEAAEKQNINY